MADHAMAGPGLQPGDVAALVLVLASVLGYGWLARVGRGRRWPRHRLLLWGLGMLSAAVAVAGPVAGAAHHSFVAHMVTHLLLGMLAPLLLVLAAPMTILLRALPVPAARTLSAVLRSRPLRLVSEPVVAANLNVGGLYLLYTTGLYPAVHRSPTVHVAVHLHMFLAGCLFTTVILSIDPMPHRRSLRHRAVMLVAALAAHDILAKYLYGHPLAGVSEPAARTGAMIMYYGGDAVDVALLVVLGVAWYRAGMRARPPGRGHLHLTGTRARAGTP